MCRQLKFSWFTTKAKYSIITCVTETTVANIGFSILIMFNFVSSSLFHWHIAIF